MTVSAVSHGGNGNAGAGGQKALLSGRSRGTHNNMAQAYLALVSLRGLESLVPETEHALPFLLRRAYRRFPYEAICCWAVVPAPAVNRVHALIATGRYLQALIALNVEAQELGTIPPDDTDLQIVQTTPW